MVFAPISINAFLESLNDSLEAHTRDNGLYYAIVNDPFSDMRMTTSLGLGFITLVMVNKKARTVDRIQMTANYMSQGARDVTVVPFEKLIVPLNYKGNAVVEAIRSCRYQQTGDWSYLLAPVLKPEEARLNQAAAGIASSFVFPIQEARDGAALIYHYFITLDKIGSSQKDFMFRYAKLVGKILNKKH